MPSDYQQICRDNIRRRGEEFDDIGRLISEQLYSDRSHFVYELLQNAEDALARRFKISPNDSVPRKVQFRLFLDRLEFKHFGVPFNEEDVKGISDVLKGTKKEDIVQIGKFGIGFKSVYAFTASPEIHSGEEHFIIKRYIRPEAKAPTFAIDQNETVFNFPFDHDELDAKEAFDLISGKLRGLGPRVLLFLRWIDEIEWRVEPDGEKGQYLKEAIEIKNCSNARRVTVIGQNSGKDEDENWLVFERYVKVPKSSNGHVDSVPVETAFLLETNTKDKTERITRIKDSPLVVFFPTEKETRLGFLIQGPYRTNPARDNIPKGDNWNVTLVQETADLVVDGLQYLKDLGLLNVALLEALPIRMDDFPSGSMFHPIFSSVREVLRTKDLLPTADGMFASAQNVRLARGADLRTLLNDDQLRSLFQSGETVKWLPGAITQDRTPDLRTYLLDELGIEEVTPDIVARKISSSFLASQSDNWFVEFYAYLLSQEALWRSPRWKGDVGGILRSKSIIRTENGSMVSPFQSDGSTANVFLPPQEDTDFPIVKRSISEYEQALNFLKRLGLSEPDVFDDIVGKVLPKYAGADASSITEREHMADIQKILRALASDSEAGKRKVIRAAIRTPFLKALNCQGEIAFKKPGDIYCQKDELKSYFLDAADVWFLGEMEGEPTWRELGVASKPRFRKVQLNLPWDERSRLRSNQGHTRDIETIDFELDGLDNCLSRVTQDSQEFRTYSAIIWNFLLEHLKESSYYRFYEGEYKWFYYQERSVCFDATWKKRLRHCAWMPKDGSDIPHRPEELSLGDLPKEFDRNEKLADLLGMKKDVVFKLAEAAGIPVEDINLLRRYPEEFTQWKAQIAARNEKPAFPIKTVQDPERRQEQLERQLEETDRKEYEERERRVRTTRGTIDPSVWLREQYTNDDDQMVCQICKKEMPFRKRDGEYYFEAVEAFSEDDFPMEHEAQFLALCPLCAAMYKELVKREQTAMAELRESVLNAGSLEIPLRLDHDTTIRFVESHWQDIKTILQKQVDDNE
jgi:hypothetical protein